LRSGPLQARSAGTPGNSLKREQSITRTAQGSNGFVTFPERKVKELKNERSSIISKSDQYEAEGRLGACADNNPGFRSTPFRVNRATYSWLPKQSAIHLGLGVLG
jgi:hypothetical protein